MRAAGSVHTTKASGPVQCVFTIGPCWPISTACQSARLACQRLMGAAWAGGGFGGVAVAVVKVVALSVDSSGQRPVCR